METEFKRKWVEALRSGKYQQTNHFLRNDHGFCCLGVACDLSSPDRWQRQGLGCHLFRGKKFEMPDDLRESVGVSRDQQATLMAKNDYGWSFVDIADYIEANL